MGPCWQTRTLSWCRRFWSTSLVSLIVWLRKARWLVISSARDTRCVSPWMCSHFSFSSCSCCSRRYKSRCRFYKESTHWFSVYWISLTYHTYTKYSQSPKKVMSERSEVYCYFPSHSYSQKTASALIIFIVLPSNAILIYFKLIELWKTILN